MKKAEKVRQCRQLMAEIKKMEEEIKGLDKLEEGPAGIISAWPTGMPRGTNNPIMALLQRMDVNDAIDRIEEYCRQFDEIA